MPAPLRLHPDDIKALAAEIVRLQSVQVERNLDMAHIASLPPAERKEALKRLRRNQ